MRVPFHYGDERLRTYEDEEGTAWFIATDVARILGHRDANDIIKGIDADEKGTKIVRTLKGEQKLSTISEAGLVTVLMRARVEAAKPFRRWITHEVLPSIRKTGSYSLPGATPILTTEDRALTRAVDEDDKKYLDVETGGGRQRGAVISDIGLIVFAARSPKPFSRKLLQWVLDELTSY